MSSLPAAPAAPLKDITQSNATSMYIYWSQLSTTGLPITGYILSMDDGLGGAFTVVYDGSLNPQKVYYIVTGLISGRLYSFSVTASNVNGVG